VAVHKAYYEEMEADRRRRLNRALSELNRAQLQITDMTAELETVKAENAILKAEVALLKANLTITGDVQSLQNELGGTDEGA
jgi:cell division protein FtsB